MIETAEILAFVAALSPEDRQILFAELQKSLPRHPLEEKLGVRADVILDSIHRAADLTQRGIRGLIAETTFMRDVLPEATKWKNKPFEGDRPYDALVSLDDFEVRIQVKMQRSQVGIPKRYARTSDYVVEVQRTRTGTKAGHQTRPYRFEDFDLLAVCMRASTGRWDSFMYAPARLLVPKDNFPMEIATFQPVPKHPLDAREFDATAQRPADATLAGKWHSSLDAALDLTFRLTATAEEQT